MRDPGGSASRKVVVVGITGASGAAYAVRLLESLAGLEEVETHVVITKAGELTIRHEASTSIDAIRALADESYDIDDIGARLASGTFRWHGMVVIPCTVATLASIASGLSDDLLLRAADVTLKERRRLVLVVRETPLHLGHIRNMGAVTEMGGIIMPPVPAFYNKPETVEAIVDQTVRRVLSCLDIEAAQVEEWGGLDHAVWTEA
jgi:flavin prenyltransferase